MLSRLASGHAWLVHINPEVRLSQSGPGPLQQVTLKGLLCGAHGTAHLQSPCPTGPWSLISSHQTETPLPPPPPVPTGGPGATWAEGRKALVFLGRFLSAAVAESPPNTAQDLHQEHGPWCSLM